jgi:hypothetical protein
MIARILDRWDVLLGEPTPGQPWFLDWVLRSPKHVGHHLTAGWLALQSLRDLPVSSCREYFGGMGAQALMVHELFPRTAASHLVTDFSPEAYDHLRRTLEPRGILTGRADAYDPLSFSPADLVMLDFGDLTANGLKPDNPRSQLIDRVAAAHPQAVVITDTAGQFLHLHRARYAEQIDSFDGYEEYLDNMANELSTRLGMHFVSGTWRRWSAVLAFSATRLATAPITRTPDLPVGLTLRSTP